MTTSEFNRPTPLTNRCLCGGKVLNHHWLCDKCYSKKAKRFVAYDLVTCKTCNKPFRRAKSLRKGRKGSKIEIRPISAVNCSKRCSREWQRSKLSRKKYERI